MVTADVIQEAKLKSAISKYKNPAISLLVGVGLSLGLLTALNGGTVAGGAEKSMSMVEAAHMAAEGDKTKKAILDKFEICMGVGFPTTDSCINQVTEASGSHGEFTADDVKVYFEIVNQHQGS